jgi:hypothetical protein
VIKEEDDTEKLIAFLKSVLTTHSVKPVFPADFSLYLKELLRAFPDNMKIYFLYKGDEVVGGTLDYFYKDKYVGWIGASKDGFSEYMEWGGIQRAKLGGFSRYENPDANSKRLVSYKSKFNPSLEMDFDIQKKSVLGKLVSLSCTKLLHKNM